MTGKSLRLGLRSESRRFSVPPAKPWTLERLLLISMVTAHGGHPNGEETMAKKKKVSGRAKHLTNGQTVSAVLLLKAIQDVLGWKIRAG